MTLESLVETQGESLFPGLISEKIEAGKSHLIAMTHSHALYEGQKFAYFGFWKPSTDEDENRILLTTFEAWARVRGCDLALGPLDVSTYFPYRLRMDPSKRVPFWGEPTNSETEIKALTRAGYSTFQDYETLTFQNMRPLVNEMSSLAQMALKATEGSGLHLAPVSLQELGARSDEFFETTDRIFSENSFYFPIPKKIFLKSFLEEIPRLIDTAASRLLLDAENRIRGYSLLLRDPADSKHVLVKSVGVEKNHRNMGLSFLALVSEGLETASSHYEKVSFCLMKKNNFPSLVSKKVQGEITNYSLFGKSLRPVQ